MNQGIRTIIAFFVLSTASPFIGNSEPPTPEISEIARQITVRILTDSGTGSGVIIQREKHTYIIVTNRHVVDDHQEQPYTILTPDGQTHQAHLLGMGRGGEGEQGSRGAGEQGGKGAGEQGSRGAGEQGSRGAGEQGSRGAAVRLRSPTGEQGSGGEMMKISPGCNSPVTKNTP